jgi:hypothetical protein
MRYKTKDESNGAKLQVSKLARLTIYERGQANDSAGGFPAFYAGLKPRD